MTPLGKYIWLLQLLQGSEGMTFESINERWLKDRRFTEDENMPILKRTFHNHIKAIREEYGIHIECGSGYKYFIADSEKEVLPKLGRLSTLNVMSETFADRKLSKSVYVDDDLQIFRDNTVISLMDAIKAQRKVILDFGLILLPDEKYRVLNVAPYQLHYTSSNWYLIGQTDEFGLMRIPLFFYFGKVQITHNSYSFPVDYSAEKYSNMIYGTTKERVHISVMIQNLHPERLNLDRYPLIPFQEEIELGYKYKDGDSRYDKYNVRVDFNMPQTPFALHVLKSRLDLHSYTILNDTDPFDLFSERQYEDEMIYPVVL